ncbi:MAG: hypothetical protein JWL76_330 [Thermoleophilia bacterium]|nr:hypothetical protein [Thermoleophilia bacterium]
MLRHAHATRPLTIIAAMLAALVVVLASAGPAAAADATAPVVTFGSWTESSPYAHYDGTADSDRLWFNPLFSGSASATIVAKDPETGVAFLNWPTPPTGWSPAGSSDTSASDAPGLVATYWDNAQTNNYPGNNFTGASVSRIDPDINFSWGSGSPHAAIGPNTFSARWSGKINLPENGVYYFQASSNDGVKVKVNGTEVLSYWTDTTGVQTTTQCAGGINLTAGKKDVVVEYYENNTNSATVQLRWRLPSQSAAYQTPTGCDTTASGATSTVRENYATGMTGGGAAQYPLVPASAFTVGGGAYTRTFSWTAAALGGVPNATANNNDAPQDTSTNTPIEFVADDQPPVAGGTGSLDIQTPGWGGNGNNTLVFPRADTNLTDAGASASNYASMTRMLQRRDGVALNGGCDTSAGSWTDIGTPGATATTVVDTFAMVPGAGVCSEFRYRITDAVGNTLDLYASGFKGWDNTPPTVTVTNIAEGTNPQYQYVASPTAVFYNGNQSGTFDVTANPTDALSGPFQVRFRGQAANNWIQPSANVDVYDPGPWTGTYQWDATSANLGNERMDVWDYAGNTAAPITHSITRDVTGPTGGAFTPPNLTTWRSTPSVAFNMTAAMGDGTGSGVASYQLQREEVTSASGACPAFTGVYTNVGAPVFGNPPPPITAVTDTTGIADGKCYRYRVEATDNVANISYLTNTNSVQVDDTDPAVTLNTVPAAGSGNITLGGTATDNWSGVASVAVRLEDLANPGPTVALYTDNSVAPAWGNYTWVTTALNGNYRLHVDVTDVAGNVVLNAITHDILIDNTVPTMVHTGFTEGTNPEYQFIDPVAANHRAWVRTTGIGAAIPSISANFLPDDPESGIDFITTPGAPAGGTPWTPTTNSTVQDPGPYTQLYSWSAGVTNFGTRNATATSNSNRTSANAAFTITADNAVPVSGAITPQTTPGPSWHTSSSIVLNITSYTDAGAGIDVQRIERDEIPRNAYGSCSGATWPLTWSTVIGTPAAVLPATVTDTTLVHGMCYRYRIVATDNVGNTTSTSATPQAVIADLYDPTATFNAAPSSPYMGTEALAGTSTDGITDGSNSGVASVTLRWLNLDDLTSGTIGTDTSAEPAWAINWNTTLGTTPDGNYRVFVDVTDLATRTVTAIVTRDVIIDNSPPLITLDSFVKGTLVDCQYWSGLPSATFWFSTAGVGCGASDFTIRANATDAPGGLAYVRFPDTATTGANIVPDAGAPADDTTGPSPYEMHYTYTTAAGSPGAEFVRARGNSNAFTDLPINLNRDTVGPTGHTITGPGGTASPAWWSNAVAPSVVFDASTATDTGGSGVRTGAHVLERRSAPGPACTAWTAYVPVGSPGLLAPHGDGTTADNTCYQYHLAAFDNVNNRTFATSANEVHVDRTLPGGTINPVPTYVRGTSVALSGTSSDNWSGVASISVRLGSGPATACTPAVAASWSCAWDTTAAPNGATTLVLVVTDRAGNVLSSQTQPTYVDNELPSVGITLAKGTNPGAQHIVPSVTPRIYINTKAGSSGDFVATATPSDGFSGVANVAYPALGTNWTRSPAGGIVPNPGPYTLTYAWTGGGTTADPGPGRTVQVADNAANFSTAAFDVVADITDPTGVTLDYADGPTSTPTVTFTTGVDTGGSGIATWRIERQETGVTGPNTCDTTWSAWTTESTDPVASPWTDGTAALNRCYRYRIVTTDNVGNETTVADTTNDTVSIEPAGIIVVENGAGPSTDVTEGGVTDTYTVRLRTRPTANVVLTLGANAQVTTSAPTLTFTTANWNAPQTVTVAAVNDDVDEVPDPHAGTITHVAASSDAAYSALSGANVVANVTDDDVSAFVVSPSQTSVAVLEAGATSDTYAVRLQTKPSANVVVTLGNSDGQVSYAPAALTFTASNWSIDQTVTITAVNDAYDEVPDAHTGVVTHAVTSTDPLYAPLTIGATTAAVTDDDTAGVNVTPTSGLTVEEGNPATVQYGVKLTSRPVGAVTVTIVDDADVDVSTTTLTFDGTDWNIAKNVTVSAFQDPIVEGPHTGTVSHTVGAPNPADAAYNSVAAAPVVVNVLDDDVPGIEVTPTSGLTATEGGTGSSYQLRLASEPTSNVTISFATGPQLQPITTLVFTPSNWNTYQTASIVAVQDDIDEVPDPHTGSIVHTVTSPDTTYAGWSLANQSVAITDDDVAAITVDELGGVDVDEANLPATDTFTVVLESEPVGTVTITPDPDAQITTSGPVTFSNTNWSTPKVITITAVNDAVDEAAIHPGSIALDVTGDPRYDALAPSPVVADVADDDAASLVVSAGTLALDEDLPASDTLTVHLGSQPSAPVTVAITTDAQATASAPTLTFTTANWNVDQTVTITAVDDPTVEDDPHPTTVGIDATAGDPGYLALSATTRTGSVADNDVPGVTINEAGGVDVTEGTGTDQYTVVLDRQPQADVVVTIATDPQVTALPSTLTFTTANWNVAQPVAVTAVDDAIDEGVGTHPGGITHSVASSDPRWATVTSAAPVAVDVTDNDAAGVTVAAASPYALDEDNPAPGTTVTYTVRLNSEPTANVDVALTVPVDLAASPGSLTFTAANWNTAQTVTVGAIDDLVTEAPVHTRTITHAITTGDTYYGAATAAPVAFDVTDNDIPGIIVSETALNATEGGADDTFSVVLETQPAANVVVDLTPTQVAVDVDPLTFTSANWNLPQTVTVDAIDDQVDEHPDTHAGRVELDVTGDPVYAGWVLADIPVAITDNDDAGVTVAPGTAAITVAEAGTTSATYTVVLDTIPTAPVTVTPTVGDGQTTFAPASRVFTSANWNTPQAFTVTAVDDPDDEPATHSGFVLHTASSLDTHYDAGLVIGQQQVDIADNDTSSVTVTPTSGLTLDEAAVGTTASFSVALTSRPLDDVDVTFDTSDGQTTVAPDPITFTPANWNVARTVTVTVVNDALDEAATHSGVIVIDAESGLDAAYDAFDPADVTVTISDDDSTGVIVTESGSSTDVDEGSTSDTYQVRLQSAPTANVTIDITGGPDASTTPVQLTFTPANWNTPQTVTVNGTPDFVVEGPHDQTITHVITAGDATYVPALAIADVVAHVTDDDAAGATISPTLVAVAEGTPGLTDTYDVVLDAEPAADVTITLTPDAEVLVSTPALVFTPLNWNSAQTVTVSANDDLVVEATTHPGVIQHAMSSSDPDFNVAVADVTADITDNDVPGVTVAPTSLTVTEGAAGATFDVVLESKPTANVDVNFTDGSGELAAMAPVTFTPATWNAPRTITVNAVNDFVDEPSPESVAITVDTASTDSYYGAGTLAIDDVDVDIVDDDTSGVLVAPNAGLAGSEGGTPLSYAVSLTSQPLGAVTVTLGGDADGTPTPGTLTFTPGNWATVQNVSVAIVQDAIAEGAHTTTITHDVSSALDPTYDTAVTVASQSIAITDDDTANVVFSPALPGPLAISESGTTATYTVQLTSEPTGAVTIDVASLAGQATPTPATLTFTSVNWMTPQTVTVAAIDDHVAEGPHADSLTHTAGGADPTYAALSLADMDLGIADNDTPGVFIDATLPDTSVAEGGLGDTVRVRLATKPTANVTVTLSSTQLVLGGSPTLTFTPTDWNTPQTITVDAIQDDVFEGPHTGTVDALTGSVGDPFYAGVAATQHSVAIADDDTAGVIVTPAAPDTLAESTPLAGRTYAVRLESEPTQPVDVTITPDAQVASATTTLTFTPGDWDTDQPVTVTPVDDAIAEASPHTGSVVHDTLSVDPAYGTGALTIDPADFSITDNDTPGVTITPTAPHAVTEGGATSSYTIVLDSQPTADVTIAPVSTQLEWTVANVVFTTTDWNVPQAVTLRAIDDSVDEASPHTGTVVHSVTTTDTGYQPVLPTGVSAAITDNDTSDLVATPVPAGTLSVDEAGALPAAQYRLTLTSQPASDVTVNLATPAPAQVTFLPTSVTLSSATWNTGVLVDVLAVQDAVDEASPSAATISHVMASGDANFDGETGPSQSIDVVDDDTAGVTITPSGASTDVAEDGSATDDYDVVLTSRPIANVTITMATPGNQVLATPATLTFTPSDWNTAQNVAVTAVQDAVFEGAHTGTITHVASSTGDPNYDPTATAIDPVVANVLDDDVPGVIVTPAGGTFEIAEGGAPDQLVVTLATNPTSPVTIDLATADGESAASPTQVVLDSTNWNTGVTVAVTAVDDGFIEGTHTASVSFTIDASASDDPYDPVAIPDATAQVSDNDAASAILDLMGGLTLDEAAVGTTDTFSIKLGASPAVGQSVDIALNELAPGGQLTFAPATISFDDTDWSTPKVVTLTVIDDDVDEADPHTGTIEFSVMSGGDPDFGSVTIPDTDASIADDDTAALVVTPATIAVAEAGTTSQTVDVKLASQPIGDVTVTVAGDAQVAATGTLTFTPLDWNTTKQVTVTALQDQDDEADPHPGHVTFDIASNGAPADPTYDALASVDRIVDIADDDASVVQLAVTGGTQVNEATPATTVDYDVVLATRPSGNVTVTLVPDAQVELVGAATLTFTPTDWATAQPVQVRAKQDAVVEGSPHPGLLAIDVGGADARYDALTPAPETIDVLDDDVAGVTVTQGIVPAPLEEDGSVPNATYDVVLTSQPIADVDVTLTPDADVAIVGGDTVLTFDATTWNAPQTVTVEAVDDLITELDPHAALVTHASGSTGDPNYATAANLAITDAQFAVGDDDQPGFTLTPVPAALTVLEAGATSQTYAVAINSIPASDVTVDFAKTSPDVAVSPASHTFDAANAATPATITVTAVDDSLVDPGEQALVTSTVNASSDAAYLVAPPIADVTVDITDDDTAGIVVDDLGGIAVAEAGATTDTFAVRLTAEPTQDVLVDFGVDTAQLEDLTGATLTFTSVNWMTPQTVTVQAKDDLLTEADPHTTTFSTVTTSADAAFSGLTPADTTVSIDDDDVPLVVVTDPADMTMAEDDVTGSARTVNVRLATIPSSPVTITASNDGQVSFLTPPVLVLNATNYATGVDLQVQPVADGIDEADPHPGVVSFTIAPTSDPGYAPLTVAPRTFSITDAAADVATVSCQDGPDWDDTSGRAQMAEDPASATSDIGCYVTIGSTPPPGKDVTIAVAATPTSQLTVDQATVTFTSADGAGSNRLVTFTATDDAIAEGAHSAKVTFDVTSTDATYDATTIGDVDIDITDNDAVGTVVTPAGPVAVTEGGATRTISLALASQPIAPVTIAIDGGAQVDTTPATITFQPTSWNVPQDISVAAKDDPVDEPDPHPGAVTFKVTAGDAGYLAYTPAPVDVSITDNDTPGVVVVPTDSGNAVAEAGTTDTLNVRLGTRPTDDVIVTLDPGTQLTATPATLTFTPANWNSQQLLTIGARQDTVVEGEHTGTLKMVLASDDATYGPGTAATPASQAVTITDDDLAGVKVVETEGKTIVAEAGTTDTYTIALLGEPTADVTIATNGGAQVTAAPATVTFTAANWSTPQTVTVSAVQDSIDEPDPHAGEVAHAATTTAAGWTGASLAGVAVSIADDDAANIIASQSSNSTRVTEGKAAGDTIRFTLSSQPTAEVSIVAKGDAQVSVSDKPVVFTPAKWKDGIELKVTAVDDEEVEGDHEGTLTFAVTSDDPSYKKASTPAIKVAVTDNDVDKALPNTTGEGDEDDGSSTRKPRASVPPATIKQPETTKDAGDERRTTDGATRTDAGSTRTPDGIEGVTTGGTSNPEGVRTGRRLGGEVVAATEELASSKRRSPVAKLADWFRDNWLLAALIVGGGTVVAGTGAWLMRGDPIKAAQRAAGSKGAAEAARRAANSRHHPHPRMRRRKKKDDDDEDEDGASPGAKRKR